MTTIKVQKWGTSVPGNIGAGEHRYAPVDNDRPKHGHVAAIMRMTRASYYYVVRHVKRRERELRETMAESVLMNKQRDILDTKEVLPGKKPSINSVDGACSPEATSDVFASIYVTLFKVRRTPTEPVELQSLYRTRPLC